MTLLRKTLHLPYRPEDLFDLVSDVARYPEFIQWMRSLRILETREDGGVRHVRAEATVGFRKFTETFVTDVVARRALEGSGSARPSTDADLRSAAQDEREKTLPVSGAPQAWTIDVSLVRGPFKRLKNTWRFAAAPGGSQVEFAIDFVFRNFVLQALAEANRDYAVGRVIDSFVAEAGRRYDKVERLT